MTCQSRPYAAQKRAVAGNSRTSKSWTTTTIEDTQARNESDDQAFQIFILIRFEHLQKLDEK